MNRADTLLRLKHLYALKSIGVDYFDTPTIHANTVENMHLPNSLEELVQYAKECTLCELAKSRKKVVFGEGGADSGLMIVGEAPGAVEDESGRVFSGRAGKLLEKILQNVLYLNREQVYITNIIKCRPPNNRAPNKHEALSCRPYLLKQIEALSPKIILTLGSEAYSYLSEDATPISKIRGEVLNFRDKILIPTYHPSYLLRNPSAKKEAYADFLKVKKFL